MRMSFGDAPIGDKKEMIEFLHAAADLLNLVAAKKEVTPAQIALAWLLAQKPWIVPIPGSRKLERLDENLGAVNINLTAADLQEIDTAFSGITVQGDRYSPSNASMVNR